MGVVLLKEGNTSLCRGLLSVEGRRAEAAHPGHTVTDLMYSSWLLWSGRDSSPGQRVPAPSKTSSTSSPASLNSRAVIIAFVTLARSSCVSMSARTTMAIR